MVKKKEPMYKLMDMWVTQKQAGQLLQNANEKEITVNEWLSYAINFTLHHENVIMPLFQKGNREKLEKAHKKERRPFENFGGIGEQF